MARAARRAIAGGQRGVPRRRGAARSGGLRGQPRRALPRVSVQVLRGARAAPRRRTGRRIRPEPTGKGTAAPRSVRDVLRAMAGARRRRDYGRLARGRARAVHVSCRVDARAPRRGGPRARTYVSPRLGGRARSGRAGVQLRDRTGDPGARAPPRAAARRRVRIRGGGRTVERSASGGRPIGSICSRMGRSASSTTSWAARRNPPVRCSFPSTASAPSKP